jgi:hypothetical protein
MTDSTLDQHAEPKIETYRQFWAIADVKRPPIALDIGGYFLLNRFTVPAEENQEITPDMIEPESYLKDYEEFLRFAKYLEFIKVLQKHFRGVCPVGQPVLRGMSDLIAVLRGHSESIIDSIESPDKTQNLIDICKNAFLKVMQEQFERIEPFHGGYFIEQYSLWAPDRIVRLQEDASALLLPISSSSTSSNRIESWHRHFPAPSSIYTPLLSFCLTSF